MNRFLWMTHKGLKWSCLLSRPQLKQNQIKYISTVPPRAPLVNLIPVSIYHYIHYKMWDKITYSEAAEVWERISVGLKVGLKVG